MEGNTRAAWDVPHWCDEVGISRPTFYVLDPQPKVARIGRRVRVVESPTDYLNRLADLQAKAAA